MDKNFLNKIIKMALDVLRAKNADTIKVRGEINFKIRRPDGSVRLDVTERNLVVTAGRNHIADQMADQNEAAMGYMACGSGTTPASASDTALESEIDRNALTSKTQGTGDDANKVVYVCDWPPGDGTGAITEAGIFNSPSAGTMLARSVFPVKNKAADESMTMTWTLIISS